VDLTKNTVVKRTPPACAGAERTGAPDALKLRAAPAGAKIWPSRVCARGANALVVENDCGCNDTLTCEIVRAGKAAIDIRVRTDPNRAPRCRDCFPMIPATCGLPRTLVSNEADDEVLFRVTVNGAPAFEGLHVEPGGFLDWGGCAE
jgi:hypothetical protein